MANGINLLPGSNPGFTGIQSIEGVVPGGGTFINPKTVVDISSGLALGLNRAIGGKDIDRNIDIPAFRFDFKNIPVGSALEAYGALGASDPMVVRAKNLPEFSSFTSQYAPVYNFVMGAAGNVMEAARERGLVEQADSIQSAIAEANNNNIPGDATAAIKQKFQTLQGLWDLLPGIESGIQSGLSEQEKVAFNAKRTAPLLPQFEAQLTKNSDKLNKPQTTESGDPVVSIGRGQQEFDRIASKDRGNFSPDEKIMDSTLGSLENWISKLKGVGSAVQTGIQATGLSLKPKIPLPDFTLGISGGGGGGGTTVVQQPQPRQEQLLTGQQRQAQTFRAEEQDFDRPLALSPFAGKKGLL